MLNVEGTDWVPIRRMMEAARGLFGPEEVTDWEPMRRMMDAAQGLFELEQERLRILLQESANRFDPLRDPLEVDYGAHRWLRAGREEVYSDWLAWILEQLGSAKRVLGILGLKEENVITQCGEMKAVVLRERLVSEGHKGHRGRMDIVVMFTGVAVIGVEVKRGPADKADTKKHEGYERWLDGLKEKYKPKILIAVAGDQEKYDGFVLYRWAHICMELRRTAEALLSEDFNPILAAMTLAFVGAVEQNILKLQAAGGRAFDSRTGDHIQSWLHGGKANG